MNRRIIAGTAGHIDHGKTTLIRSLTGTNTDRLKEEQERGITIELGFAHLRLPSGDVVGIVDVPGHEKFVRHMVAGAAGIDLVMLVVAADEGIMPQTREHLDICRMLGIHRGLVVLTKTDLVDSDWLDLVTEEVRGFVRGTFLEGEPIVPVSSQSGRGIPELLAALERMCEEVDPRPPWGIFRMPVDRVFTMKGFGTVVTGTTVSGTIRIGETVRVYPGDLETKVRGLQVHNESVPTAEAGFRTAINLQGVEKSLVRRGDVVGCPGQMTPSFIMDVRLQLLPAAPPLSSRARVRFHLGTGEIFARVHLLDSDTVEPGGEALAQIRLEAPTAALARDRFVIRSYSPAHTLGGGTVIDPAAEKTARRRNTVQLLEKLRSLERGSPEEAVAAAIRKEGSACATPQSLSRSLNVSGEVIGGVADALVAAGTVVRLGPSAQDPLIHAGVLDELKRAVVSLVERFHRDNPMKPGLPREEIKTKLPRTLPPKALAFLLQRMEEEGLIAGTAKTVRLASYLVSLDPAQEVLRDRIAEAIRSSGGGVPSPQELSASLRAPLSKIAPLLELLTGEGLLVKISEEIYLHRETYDRLAGSLLEHFAGNPELTVGDFKDKTGLTRKYVIPILEHFDRQGITLRVGDRRMRKGS